MSTLSRGERRRAERSERDDFALGLARAGTPLAGVELKDVSTAGFGFRAQSEAKAGQELSFELRLPAGSLRGRAVVAWAEPFHIGYRGGARFKGLGFFQRRRLREALAAEAGSRPGWLVDTVLMALAAATLALVAADMMHNPAVQKVLAPLLQKAAGR